MMKSFLNIIVLFLLSTSIFAQQENNQVRGGNKRYDKEKFVDAEVSYRKALEINNKSFEANYNLGNALFKQEKYADALDFYQKAAALQTQDKLKMAATLHNLGNALLSSQKIEESIEAYKRALKANPKDNETRYNLAVAQHLLKKQQQNQDNQNEQEKEQQQQQQEQQEQDAPKPDPKKISKENAEQILEALKQDEKNTLEKVQQQPVRGRRSAERDW